MESSTLEHVDQELLISDATEDAPVETKQVKNKGKYLVIAIEISLFVLSVIVIVLSIIALYKAQAATEDNADLTDLYNTYISYEEEINSTLDQVREQISDLLSHMNNDYNEIAKSFVNNASAIVDDIYNFMEEEMDDQYEELEEYLEKMVEEEAGYRADNDIYVYNNATLFAINVNKCYSNRAKYNILKIVNQTDSLDNLEEEYKDLLNKTGWSSCP